MRELEDGLAEVEAALKKAPNLTMTVFKDDVPSAANSAIRELIDTTRTQIRVVMKRYGLSPQVLSNRQRFITKLSILSIDLTEATSRYMRVFGEVPEEERQPLDDQIGKLITLVEKMKALSTV
jgi:hypothetical protein